MLVFTVDLNPHALFCSWYDGRIFLIYIKLSFLYCTNIFNIALNKIYCDLHSHLMYKITLRISHGIYAISLIIQRMSGKSKFYASVY